jgi:BirA family biotin operon repressor/biotin-[acetyl-CoA-carboxylase] ligase
MTNDHRQTTSDAVIDTQSLLANTFLAHAEHHRVLDSTQTRARALAEDAAAHKISLPALIVADSQTAGRGRASNRWWTGEGSLAFSVLVDPEQFGFPRRAVPRLSLAAGVAIIDALAPRLADHPPGLHWPNDVYVGHGKLAGILVEVLPAGWHIIGVGLNSNNTASEAPLELRDSIATLRDLTGHTHDHTELLLAILENLEAALTQLGQPLETIGERFDLLCRQRGEMLTVFQGQQTITGRCVGIAPDGALLLDTAEGRRAVHSGTLRPPTNGEER